VIGRKQLAVLKRRRRLGIPNNVPARFVWTEAQIALIGTMSDRELGDQIGCPSYVVTFKRRSLRIPAERGRVNSK
jgi:hypothetical protein